MDPDSVACWLTLTCWPCLIVDFFYQLTLTFGVDHWPKCQNFWKGLSCLVFHIRFQFWTLFLHLKLLNWSIGKFFIMVSSKAFFKVGIFKESSHAYLTSSLHWASALSLREGVKDILDILAQYNRLKPTIACTSSLGLSRLYILMLGFIVI